MSSEFLIVIFATHNGAETLGRVLEGYARLDQPERPWRMIAVNNRSTDDTGSILAGYQDRLPLSVLDEPRPGKNVALHRAVKSIATGGTWPELCIFTDDDAVPHAGFLKAWERTGQRKRDHDLFGGQVTPEWMVRPPEWLAECEDRYPELYAQNRRPEGDIPARHIFGPNMAVRSTIFARGFRFNEDIGPDGSGDYAMGSETEFCVRVERDIGARSYFVGDARVSHLVRPWQMSHAFFASRAVRHGRGVARQQSRDRSVSPRALLKASWGVVSNHARASLASGHSFYRAKWQENWWKGYFSGSLPSGRSRG